MSEEEYEIKYLTYLASNLGDGMKVLKPANIAGPIRKYDVPLPEYLSEVETWVSDFFDWQLERKQAKDKHLMWSQIDSENDVLKYVIRKVWQLKVQQSNIINPVARMLATTVSLHKKYRSDTHEALNHVAKHNENVKVLGNDLKDELDKVVKDNLEIATKAIAGAALVELPQLQKALIQEDNE